MAKNFDQAVDAVDAEEVEEQLGFLDGAKICWNAVKRSKLAKVLAIGAAAAGAAVGGIVLAGKVKSGKELPDDDESYYLLLDHHEDDECN